MTTWATDYGNFTPIQYFQLFGQTRLERGLNMYLGNYILAGYPFPLINPFRIYYLIASQTFPLTGNVHIIEWNGFIHNSKCTCIDYINRHNICKHLYCIRIANLI